MTPIEMHVRCLLETPVFLVVHPGLDNESSCSLPFVMHFTPVGCIARWVFLNPFMYLQVSYFLEFSTSAYTSIERVLSLLCCLFLVFEDPECHMSDYASCSCRSLVWNMPSGSFTFCGSEVTRAVVSILIYSNLVLCINYPLCAAHCFILFRWRG